jgi:hypothetical protein
LLEIYRGDYSQFGSNELDSWFAEVQWSWTFNPKLSILNSIKISGQINTIQNSRIQSFITSYEELVRDASEESLIVRSLIVDKYVPRVNRYISEGSRAKYIGYAGIDRSKFKSDYAGIFNDREAESLIAYIYIWHVSELEEEQSMLTMMKDCISIVKEELAR